ncbi:MAG: alcohol dehydrogenase catalytic domain-containing protein [Halieaceae bacterium]|nr:alcohol dehydrogenase catalytic domain-containing protein [Halieaceae bacterium]
MSKLRNFVLSIPRPGETELIEKPYPNVRPGYAIVKMEIAPVCLEGTRIWADHDFEKLHGGAQLDYPDALGHEGVGVVHEVQEGQNLSVGDRVIIFQGDHCGQCYSCHNALSPTYCDSNIKPREGLDRPALGGIQDWNKSESGGWAMAQYRLAPIANIYKMPDELSFKTAAAANCSFGAAWSNQEIMGVRNTDTVLIGGIGFIALGHVISALSRGAKVIALIRNAYRKQLLEQMGVKYFVNPSDSNWLEQVLTLTYRSQGVDHAIECSGTRFYQEKMFEATRMYGNINFSGHTPDAKLDFNALDCVTHKAHTLTGQHDVRAMDRDSLIQAMLKPEVQSMIDIMITHEYPMTQAGEAFATQVSKQCGKIYLYPQL